MSEERTIVNVASGALLEEFKRHIRMASNDMDADLLTTLAAAVAHAEHHIGKVILRSQFVIECPFTSSVPLKAPDIDVQGFEVDGTEVTGFSVDGRTFNAPQGISGSQMKITYIAGYNVIPPDMKKAIFLHATSLFNNPADSVEVLTKASQNLLRPYRTWGLD